MSNADYGLIDYQNGFAMLCKQMGLPADATFSRMRQAYSEASHRTEWPDLVPPPMYDDPHPDWRDPAIPDMKKIWTLARDFGYAVGVHGSLKRDVDLIAVAWTEDAASLDSFVNHMKNGLNASICGSEMKPHGRFAVTLQIDGYYKPIDLSVISPGTDLFGSEVGDVT